MANGEMEHLSSGNSTPSGAAPPAPRMVPDIQGATLQKAKAKPLPSVAALRQAAAIKKQVQPASSSDARILAQLEKLTHEVKELTNVKKTLQDEVKSAKERESKLVNRITLLESQNFKQVQEDVARMADELTRTIKQPDFDNQQKSHKDLNAKVEKQMGENLRLSETVEKQSKMITGLKGKFDEQANGLEEMSKKTAKAVLDGQLKKQSRDISELSGKLNQQANELKKHSKDISEINGHMNQMDLLNEALQDQSNKIVGQQTQLDKAENNQSDLSGRLITIEEQVKVQKSAIQDISMDPQTVLECIQTALNNLPDDIDRLQALGIDTGLKAAIASWLELSLKTSLQPLDSVKHLEVEVGHLKKLEAQVLQTRNVVEIIGNKLLVEVEDKLKKQREELQEETKESNAKIERLELEVSTAGKQCSVHQHLDTPETTERRLTGIEHALNHLQDRYDNMSTEDLYGRLVHWLATHFNNDLGLQINFRALRDELTDLTNNIKWIHDREQPLVQLSSNHQKLLQLLDPAQQLQLNEQLLQSMNSDSNQRGAAEPRTMTSVNHSQDRGAQINDLVEEMKTVTERLNQISESSFLDHIQITYHEF